LDSVFNLFFGSFGDDALTCSQAAFQHIHLTFPYRQRTSLTEELKQCILVDNKLSKEVLEDTSLGAAD